MARRIGVRVLTFSLGFGPKLLSFKRGDTEYCVSAIPLGGYVKMAGENPEDSRTGADDEFLSKTKWQRFQVLVMGPVMNLALAIVVMTLVLYQGTHVADFDDDPVVVGKVLEGSAGAEAGIRPGDRILQIGDKPTDTWEDFPMAYAPKAGKSLSVLLIRDGKTVRTQVTPKAVGKYEIGEIGVFPAVRPEIAEIFADQPAEHAGLKVGGIILAVGGEKDVEYDRLIQQLRSHDGKPLTLDVLRDGQPTQITVTPKKSNLEYATIG